MLLSGLSEFSKQDQPPLAPDAPTLTVRNGQLGVEWTEPNNGGSAINEYHLRYRANDSGSWTDITEENITGTSHIISGLVNGTSYVVQVRAVNVAGAGSWSDKSEETPLGPPIALDAPTLTVGNTQLSVAWSAPVDNGGSAITRYQLQYRTGGGAWMPITSGIGTSTSHTITGLTNGDSYHVQVRAVNVQGSGAWSTSATAMLPVIARQVPSGTETVAILSAAIYNQIANENLTVSLTTATSPSSTVTLPTVDPSTGVITVTARTTAGTYVVSGEDGVETEQFSEYFYVTESPTTNAELKTAVTDGISNWGNTANLNYIITTTVTDMSYMFYSVSAFNGDISGWDTGAVTNMSYMFNGASAFSQNLEEWKDHWTLGYGNKYTGYTTDMFVDSGVDGTEPSWYGPIIATQIPSGTPISAILSAAIYNQIADDNLIVSLTTVTSPISTVTLPTVDPSTGVIMATAHTTAGTYVVSGEDGGGTEQFSEYFYVTESPTNSEIGTTVGTGRSTWGNTANLNYIITTDVTDMSYMFYSASAFNGDISGWDVSKVTNMSVMFHSASAFNGDISGWDVSKVTNMSVMFHSASAFNGDISGWDVSKVTDMSYMFYSASAFNGDISGWDVSKVWNMSGMFNYASVFNGDISGWNVSKVRNMSRMFYDASVFNGDISGWNVSKVGGMSRMFYDANAFNKDISNWNVSSVTNMSYMFFGADAFNGDISGWDTGAVTNMSYMFNGASAFSQNLEEWKDHWTLGYGNKYTGYTTDMFVDSGVDGTEPSWYGPIIATQIPSGTPISAILSDAIYNQIVADNLTVSLTTITSPSSTVTLPTVDPSTGVITVTARTTAGIYVVSGEDGGGTEQFSEHFSVTVSPTTNAELKTAVTDGISNWGNTANLNYIITTDVTNMSYMFYSASAFNGDISDWDVSSVTNMFAMFQLAEAFNGDISNWDVSLVADMTSMFSGAEAFNGDISDWDVSSVTNMLAMFRGANTFNGDISNWDVSSVTNMLAMFTRADAFNGDISGWDTGAVTTMSYMFNGANAFNKDISNWNVSSVTNMSYMFSGAEAFNGDISDWDVSKVTNMTSMFSGANVFNGDISDWDVSKVTNMTSMFSGANAFNRDISNWNVSLVTDMTSMFNGANAFNKDISNWNVSSVTSMYQMFYYASAFNSDISGWDVSSVTNMEQMFYYARAFSQNLEEWKEHLTLDGRGKYTGVKTNMFHNSGVTGDLLPSWY